MLPRPASKRDEDGVVVAIDGHAVAAGAGVAVACAPGYEGIAFAGELSAFLAANSRTTYHQSLWS